MEIAEVEMEDSPPEFTLAEALKMEKLYRKQGIESPEQELCEKLATKFSCSVHRTGISTIKWEQVQSWFRDRQILASTRDKNSVTDSDSTAKPHINISSSPIALKNLLRLSKAWAAAEKPHKPKGQRVSELSDLTFEALSSKDCAWFDVAAFLNFRILYSGELEIRVRFSGFSHDEDEWVNARNGIRERSIPLEPSECQKVKVGDLILCYRANEDHALYSDAHVIKLERQMHDNYNCTCNFVVRFEYDYAEVQVQCSHICRRPS